MSSITPRADVLWLAEYLYWLRDRILAIAGGLTDAQFLGTPAINGRDLRATLVHELDVEIGWRARLQGEPPNRWNDESTLHPEAFPSLAAIEQRWRTDEAEMRGWLSGLTEADLARTTTTSGLEGYSLGIYLMHAVEHGVGEFTNAAAILTAIGRSPGDLGLLDALDDLAPMPPGDDGNAE